MTSRRVAALARAVAVALAAAGTLACQGGDRVFDSDRKNLVRILGSNSAPWLDDGEITPFTPNPDYQPELYFVKRRMARSEFARWAQDAGLQLSETPTVTSSLFAPPPELDVDGWLPRDAVNTGPDAQLLSDRVVVLSRWAENAAYTVVRPTY